MYPCESKTSPGTGLLTASLCHPTEHAAQKKVVQDKNARVATKGIKHVDVKRRIAHPINNAVVFCGMPVEKRHRAYRKISANPGVSYRILFHNYFDFIEPGQFRQKLRAIIGNAALLRRKRRKVSHLRFCAQNQSSAGRRCQVAFLT